eukprot:6573695-Prymnesium_polylepis.1
MTQSLGAAIARPPGFLPGPLARVTAHVRPAALCTRPARPSAQVGWAYIHTTVHSSPASHAGDAPGGT